MSKPKTTVTIGREALKIAKICAAVDEKDVSVWVEEAINDKSLFYKDILKEVAKKEREHEEG